MRVAIIGGGASGLVTARILREFGHDVVLHEKAADLGGVWSASRRYPGISTQDDRRTYSFSDFPMPSHLPEHPAGADVRRYLEAYSTAHRLEEVVRLGSEVVRVEREGAGWRVRSQAGTSTSEEVVDFVVIANGVFSDPHVPAWPGQDAFEAAGGTIVQPSRLGDGDRLRDRDVLVIGWGKTACDLAASASAIARSAAIVARAVRWKHPKRIGRYLTFRHLLMTRTGSTCWRRSTDRCRAGSSPGSTVRSATPSTGGWPRTSPPSCDWTSSASVHSARTAIRAHS
ncbi:flavin-containing monooxygenase [Amnibacterium kyonggiense]